MSSPTRDAWKDIKAVLLYDAGFTLAEVGKYCGGISRQGVHQRLQKLGYQMRPPGNRERTAAYPPWQLRLIERVRDMGLSQNEVADLLSLRSLHPIERGKPCRYGRPADGFRTRLASAAWFECRDLILAAARLDGATHQQLADLAGFHHAETACMMTARKFPNMPNAAALRLLLKLTARKREGT